MNMSYCRFQNTVQDLRDCFDNWEEIPDDELSDDEVRARKRLLKLCQEIARDYGDAQPTSNPDDAPTPAHSF